MSRITDNSSYRSCNRLPFFIIDELQVVHLKVHHSLIMSTTVLVLWITPISSRLIRILKLTPGSRFFKMPQNMPGRWTNLTIINHPGRYGILSFKCPKQILIELFSQAFIFLHLPHIDYLDISDLAYIQRIVPSTVKSHWPIIFSTAEISSMSRCLHTPLHLQTITDYASVNQKITCEASEVLPVLNTNGEHQKSTQNHKQETGGNEAASR